MRCFALKVRVGLEKDPWLRHGMANPTSEEVCLRYLDADSEGATSRQAVVFAQVVTQRCIWEASLRH